MDCKIKLLVVGLGKTGLAVANRLAQLGAEVTVTDELGKEELQIALLNKNVQVEAGGYGKVVGVTFDLVVASPGVPFNSALLENFRGKGVEVISEIELAFRLARGSWIGITGTNGKTTAASLVGAMLGEAKIPAVLCGNIGNPAIGEDAIFEKDKIVLAEISSFQLESVSSFAPRISAILNLAPDHLDRHLSMENYASIKSLIFARQKPTDFCVLNADDPLTAGLCDGVPSRVIWFSAQKPLDEGAFIHSGQIVVAIGGKKSVIGEVKKLRVEGLANLENALAGCAIATVAGADCGSIRRALYEFRALPHRMEPVAEVGSVRYINDSKATNVSATIKALEGLDGKVILILGGRDKNGDFAPLATAVRQKNVCVILIGEAAPEIATAFAGYKKISRAQSLEDAVRTASDMAGQNSTVLLSPACASFDMFKNYEERGESFRRATLALESGKGVLNA